MVTIQDQKQSFLHTTKDYQVLHLHVGKICIIVTNDDHGKLNYMIKTYMDVVAIKIFYVLCTVLKTM
jgi:hypothetical protein